jgi:ankyrin repeat protein
MVESPERLSQLVDAGDVAAVRAALQAGLDPNVDHEDGMAPLERAVRAGHLELVRTLLEFGAQPAPALWAALWSCTDEAPAQAAEVLAALLDAGADANWQDEAVDDLPTDCTALYLAAEHPELVRVLLQHGADPNRANRHGETPLSFACDWGHLASVRALLAGGANPNHALPDLDWTILMFASASGHEAIVDALLDAGADPLRVNEWGQSALSVALDYKHPAVARLLIERAPAAAALVPGELTPEARRILDEALALRGAAAAQRKGSEG